MAAETEWAVELPEVLVKDLQESFDNGPIVKDGNREVHLLTEFLVDQIGGLKVEVFANEHPPPHFRVKYAGDTANFKIDDCSKINGGLDKWYRNIRKWHGANKETLIKAWDETRPTDCPVGKYREN